MNINQTDPIKLFMREKGYTNFTNESGIRKAYPGGTIKTFVTPDKMLREFKSWLKKNKRFL